MSNSNELIAFDLIEEKTLTFETSDDVLEGAAGAATARAEVASFSFCTSVYVCPWS